MSDTTWIDDLVGKAGRPSGPADLPIPNDWREYYARRRSTTAQKVLRSRIPLFYNTDNASDLKLLMPRTRRNKVIKRTPQYKAKFIPQPKQVKFRWNS